MTDPRWGRVKELFQAAVEQPAAERSAFLAAAAEGDDSLRREVESLLAADDGSVLEPLPLLDEMDGGVSPIAPTPSTNDTEPRQVLSPPYRIGSYEVIASLGAGGMGEVYRARDTKLNRDVALKVLPAVFARDQERFARFRREAQLLAALNHQNVAAIYGLEESCDVQALVLELVEGPTLADQIARGPIPMDQALPIARQIAEALEVAHDQSIVHRDLKPSNVKVRPDGLVKVLDFGLAKALAPGPAASTPGQAEQSPRLRDAATRDGIILGTAPYMSPEQAKGQPVDRRADIWAFGCVLFEMIAGRPAFHGDTVTELLAAVVKDEPDWAALPGEVPPGIHTLLRRCLNKDPRQRLQAIGDARIEIDAIDDAPPADVRAKPHHPSKHRKRWQPWLAVAALGMVVAIREVQRPAPAQNDPLANAQFSRFTNWEGTESGAEISPDGKFVAFLADKEGQFDIWLSQVGTGDFRNLTTNVEALQPSGPTFRKFGFSGDGAEIWFSPETGPSMAQMIMPFMGGLPRAFLDKGATAPSWSPDGSRLAYFRNEDGDPLVVADRMGADARQILVQKEMHHHNPAWSSDGQWIYFARGPDPTEAMDVWRIRPSGESMERLTGRGTAVNFIAPLDTRMLLYVARDEDRSGPWLWALDVERKQTRRVSSGLGQYTSVSVSRNGRRVVATVANPTTSLWRVPLLDRQVDDRDVQAYSLPTARAQAPRFAGPALFYLSAGGMGDGLWRVQDGEAIEIAKGTEGGLFEPATVSPDGSRAAIIVRREGRRRLVVVSADGRSSRTLAASLDIEGAAGQGAADWSPDGAWIVIGGRDAEGRGLFKISVETGMPVQLLSGRAVNPIWSPDGNLIVYAGRFFTGQVELLGVRPDGTRVEIPHVRTRPGGYRFLPDGTGLVYQQFIPARDFWLLDFATNSHRQLTRLSYQGAIGTFDITPDGKSIVFDRTRENSDVVLIQLPE